MARRRKARRGLTLIEVMVAVMVLAGACFTASALFPAAMMIRERSGGDSRAAAIVQRKLEQIRRLPAESITYAGLRYSNLIDQAGGSPYPFTATDAIAAELTNGAGSLTITNPGSDLVTVTVTVTWKSVNGPDRSMSATTNVCSREIWREG